jgi:hypothetical protein
VNGKDFEDEVQEALLQLANLPRPDGPGSTGDGGPFAEDLPFYEQPLGVFLRLLATFSCMAVALVMVLVLEDHYDSSEYHVYLRSDVTNVLFDGKPAYPEPQDWTNDKEVGFGFRDNGSQRLLEFTYGNRTRLVRLFPDPSKDGDSSRPFTAKPNEIGGSPRHEVLQVTTR